MSDVAVVTARRVLNLQCPDTRGVVAAVAGFLADRGANITEASQFTDHAQDRFFMRAMFETDGMELPAIDELRTDFAPVAGRFGMAWRMADANLRPRALIAVSRFGHCLYDLLHRWRSGILPVEIVGVVSNHEDMRSFVEWNGLPYVHLPVTPATKARQEAQFLSLVDDWRADMVVLARYMQVLSDELCRRLAGRCINIHHSFLPSFKGATPYHQAHARGVKIIGATAHYVTSDLDEGPIIEQSVERVDHSYNQDHLVAAGRDVEAQVLSRAVRWHSESRVLVNGDRTVVFR